ncbi:hypothetical protein EIP91_000215, partial [Steccherinum ochraceum]
MDQVSSLDQSDIFFVKYMRLVGITILYYDYLLTLPGEVAYIWQKPRSIPSYLFLLNRYFSILASFVIDSETFQPFQSDALCHAYALFRQISLLVAQFMVCAILIIRTYALWGRSRRILACMITTSVVLAALSLWALTAQKHATSYHSSCYPGLTKSAAIHLAVGWECLFVFDTLIVSLTVYRSYKEIAWSRAE